MVPPPPDVKWTRDQVTSRIQDPFGHAPIILVRSVTAKLIHTHCYEQARVDSSLPALVSEPSRSTSSCKSSSPYVQAFAPWMAMSKIFGSADDVFHPCQRLLRARCDRHKLKHTNPTI
ncbi:hypothetical protein M404DRAFT_580247 [Pisolithus tinctorius Marx 270]|uniref:Uncharacterized protein n=1 Tax=Pisolithus tinctorius Marx 270 TaxID=870435 RepID=A0A0C3PHF8_PISTI|nr:hypothetical protein M404DRAFT_580247 [Pisolithus tinctorius Marx 270]